MKNVLIIGASSDLAIELAKIFASNGHNIVLASRNIEKLKKTSIDIINKFSVECNFYEFDININEPHSLLNKLEKFPDILISTIGLNQKNQFTVSDFELILSTNFLRLALFIEYFISQSEKNKLYSSILITSSIAGIRGRAVNYIYGSAKSALTEYLSGLRQKYNERLHIMTIIPGYIKTQSLPKDISSKFLCISSEKMANKIFKAFKYKREIVYSPYWFIISIILKMIPEQIFKKLKF